ncbi:MAG: TolC family protein [Clostridia bacterium]
MRKKLTAVLVALTLVLLTTTSALVGASDAAEEKTFSLQQAIDYALENSPLIVISETGIEKAKVSSKEARSVYNKAEDAPVMAFESQLSKDGYYKRMAEMGLKLAEQGKVQTVESVKFAVENNYFTLLNAKENLNIQEDIYNLAVENLNIANQKYDLGTISEIELLSFKTSVAQAEVDRKSAQRALEYAQMNFNKALGMPLNTKVQLTDAIKVEAPESIDIEEKVSQAFVNRMEIISAKEQYEADKLYFEITAKWYPSNTYKHQQAKQTVELSEYSLTNTNQTVEISVRKAHMDMLDAYESLVVLQQTEEQLQKVYDIAKIKYENGMGTNTEVLEAMNQLKEIKLGKSKAQLGYNLTKKQFEVSYGVGLGSASMN